MTSQSLSAVVRATAPATVLAQLAAIPEEEIWLSKQKSARTRRAYRCDVAHFLHDRHHRRGRAPASRPQGGDRLGADQARARERGTVDHPPVASRRSRRCSSTWCGTGTRRRTRWPRSSGRRSIATRARRLAFSKAQARKILDTPAEDTVAGLRATGRFCRSACRSGSPRSRRSALAICIRTAAMTHFASCARADGGTRLPSIRRPPRGYAPISRRPGTALTPTGHIAGVRAVIHPDDRALYEDAEGSGSE
jgi:hypothetical protein